MRVPNLHTAPKGHSMDQLRNCKASWLLVTEQNFAEHGEFFQA